MLRLTRCLLRLYDKHTHTLTRRARALPKNCNVCLPLRLDVCGRKKKETTNRSRQPLTLSLTHTAPPRIVRHFLLRTETTRQIPSGANFLRRFQPAVAAGQTPPRSHAPRRPASIPAGSGTETHHFAGFLLGFQLGTENLRCTPFACTEAKETERVPRWPKKTTTGSWVEGWHKATFDITEANERGACLTYIM